MASFPKKHILRNERRNYQPKEAIQSRKKKCDREGQETFAFVLLILNRFLLQVLFIFSFLNY